MSESRNCGESRSYTPSYGPYSAYFGSESRQSSESRVPYESVVLTSESHSASESVFEPSESRLPSESCSDGLRKFGKVSAMFGQLRSSILVRNQAPVQYNTFDEIDTLIEQLEISIPVLQKLEERGTRYEKALQRRKDQLERLRRIKEDRIISEIEKESDLFEEKIEGIKRLTKSPLSPFASRSFESHDSGESRW